MRNLTYIIREGRHFGTDRTNLIAFKTRMEFDALLDESCLYTPTQNPPQINKLFGFSFGFHQGASARIGWHADGEKFWFHSYVYTAPGKMEHRLLGPGLPGEVHHFMIRRTDLLVDIEMDREIYHQYTLEKACFIGYLLHPYFGGQVPAPHEMTIRLQNVVVSWL
ncbi:MAG: hypothetical protein H6581_07070 [Bacteroidia bacterium]|nr:hypothetical protein [Bacteroidia bacterium]